MDSKPKAFISHASEDKDRFVLSFAEKLRANGIDVWLDKWEMLPGDSLVDKIFEEGIKEADIFIIVLSSKSVSKPWVREELNAGIVKRISNSCKIVPILIDDCDVPECLKSTLWQKISDLDNYEDELKIIINSIFGIVEKPALGEPPKHVTTKIDIIPGLTKADSIVFSLACQLAIDKGSEYIDTSAIRDDVLTMGITDEEFHDSLVILDEQFYIKATKVMSRQIPIFQITTSGFDQYVKSQFDDYENMVAQVCLKILNEQKKLNTEIAEQTGFPLRIVDHIFETLESKGLIKQIKTMGPLNQIVSVSPQLKRMFN